MLYLHCGWPRTGTTTLQAALVARRDALADAGVAYPDQWRPNGVDNHHGIHGLVAKRGPDPESAMQRLLSYLESRSDGTVLLSSESLSYWLPSRGRDALLDFVAKVRAVVPVTCIWTLRSIPDFMSSLYLRQVQIGSDVPLPADFIGRMADRARWEDAFGGFGAVEELVDAVYIEYARDGTHNDVLLRTVGAPEAVRSALRDAPRRNARLTHKAASAMLFSAEISRRAGTPIARAELRDLFYRRGFRFDDDRPCALIDEALAERLRRSALAAARNCGFAPYVEFFGEERIESGAPVEIGPEALDDDDLRLLVAHLGTPASQSLQ